MIRLIGKVPYLNGGLFDIHELEKDNDKLDVKDEAFERLFDFFDEYNWHLDDRITASGKDINPDVFGYIFEKYINDRASMGAYYTKEDITEFIQLLQAGNMMKRILQKSQQCGLQFSIPPVVQAPSWLLLLMFWNHCKKVV